MLSNLTQRREVAKIGLQKFASSRLCVILSLVAALPLWEVSGTKTDRSVHYELRSDSKYARSWRNCSGVNDSPKLAAIGERFDSTC
jgi:hypothetical protein